MKSEQPASPGRPVLNPPDSNHDSSLSAKAAADAPPAEPVYPDAPSAIAYELLRLLHKLGDEPPKSHWIKRLPGHPMALVVLTFILSVLLGGYLTNQYTLRQQEMARQRSFTDEVNKIRVQKIGEVWEHIDRTEVDLDAFLDRANKAQDYSDKDLKDITKLVEDEVAIVNKNRFWLGEKNYNRIKNYLNLNGAYALDKLLGRPGIDLTETVRKRDQAKQDILQIRSMFLKGELEP